jgi:hypothetical protein
VSLFRVKGAAAAAVLVASGFGVVTVACAGNNNNTKKDPDAPSAAANSGSGWRGWLPHGHKDARPEASVPTLESIEAAQAVLDAAVESHVGGHVAERGIGSQIEGLTVQGALEVARDERLHLPIEQAIITKAPKCPPPINRKHPVLLKVALETTAKVMQVRNETKRSVTQGCDPNPRCFPSSFMFALRLFLSSADQSPQIPILVTFNKPRHRPSALVSLRLQRVAKRCSLCLLCVCVFVLCVAFAGPSMTCVPVP